MKKIKIKIGFIDFVYIKDTLYQVYIQKDKKSIKERLEIVKGGSLKHCLRYVLKCYKLSIKDVEFVK